MHWVIQNARIETSPFLVDIGIANGRIVSIDPARESAENGYDLAGRVLLPGLIDAHTHLDKTYSSIENDSGTLLEAIDVWRRIRPTRTYDAIQTTARRALHTAITNGVTALRTHIDISRDNQFVNVAAINDLRREMAHLIDVQLVALGSAGTSLQSRAALEHALMIGADLVGGAPALCADPRADIDAAFAVAERFGRHIDLHIDETEDPNMLTLAYLAEKTIMHGMQGCVTAGHCCSLAFVDPETAQRTIDRVAEAQINLVTLPSCNLVLMGRTQQPTPRGTTPVKALLAAGVNVCAASDNVRDPFNPFGSYDLLHIANLNAHVAHMTGAAELQTSLEMVTARAAQTMGIATYGIAVGNSADLVVLDTTNPLDAVISPPSRLATIKAGKRIVETKIERRTSFGEG